MKFNMNVFCGSAGKSAVYLCDPRALKLLSIIDHVKENWRSVATFVCLCLAYMVCNAAYSLFAPFFPEEVRQPVALLLPLCKNSQPDLLTYRYIHAAALSRQKTEDKQFYQDAVYVTKHSENVRAF